MTATKKNIAIALNITNNTSILNLRASAFLAQSKKVFTKDIIEKDHDYSGNPTVVIRGWNTAKTILTVIVRENKISVAHGSWQNTRSKQFASIKEAVDYIKSI